MHKKMLLILICIFITSSLTACYDSEEIDDTAYVMAIGIDKGVDNIWRLSVQFPTMKQDSGGGGQGKEGGKKSGGGSSETGDQDGYTTITIDASGFLPGINAINTFVPRKLNFMHTKFVVVSEEVARSGKLGELLAPIIRYRQIRRTLHVIVSRGTAMDFIKDNRPFIGTTLSKTMEDMVKEADDTGFFPHVTLEEFYDGIKSTYRQAIATLGAVNDLSKLKDDTGGKWYSQINDSGQYYAGELPRKGGNKTELFGTAVFDGDKMVGELNGDETRLLLMGRGDFKRAFYAVQDPQKPDLAIGLDIRQARKPKVTVSFKDTKPVIHLKLLLEGDILSIQSRINYESEELKPVLENAFRQYIKNGMDKLLKKCRNLKADVFQFGRTAVMQFGTIEEWEKYNWKKQFEEAEITTEVDFTIRRTGSQIKNSPIVTPEGKE